jgi:hypothetical protein
VPWYLARTGNALVRRSSLPSCEAPFDERFGLTGGEDVDLFFRMAERGARLIAVESARVSESRPYQRCSAWWMLKRCFRRGGTVVDVAWRHTRGGARWRAGRRAARASLVAAARAVRHAKTPPRSFDHLLDAAQSLGMVAAVLGYRYREYGRPR